jgi:hypothetical protein
MIGFQMQGKQLLWTGYFNLTGRTLTIFVTVKKETRGIFPYLILQNKEIALKKICKASSQAPNVISIRIDSLSGKNRW